MRVVSELGTSEAASARAGATAGSLNALRRIMRALRLAAGVVQHELGISAAQLYVLRQLEAGGVQSITSLAVGTMTDRSSVAAVVDRLVERGLAERTRSPVDRRRADIRLTAAGRDVLAAAPPAPTTLLLRGLDGLRAEELEALTQSLERLVAALGIDSSPAGLLFFEQAADS